MRISIRSRELEWLEHQAKQGRFTEFRASLTQCEATLAGTPSAAISRGFMASIRFRIASIFCVAKNLRASHSPVNSRFWCW